MPYFVQCAKFAQQSHGMRPGCRDAVARAEQAWPGEGARGKVGGELAQVRIATHVHDAGHTKGKKSLEIRRHGGRVKLIGIGQTAAAGADMHVRINQAGKHGLAMAIENCSGWRREHLRP